MPRLTLHRKGCKHLRPRQSDTGQRQNVRGAEDGKAKVRMETDSNISCHLHPPKKTIHVALRGRISKIEVKKENKDPYFLNLKALVK